MNSFLLYFIMFDFAIAIYYYGYFIFFIAILKNIMYIKKKEENMNFEKYFVKLIKKASSKLHHKISDIKYDSDTIEFVFFGVSMYGYIIRHEQGTNLRLYFDIINKKFDMNDNEALLKAFPIINEFNLIEGGLLQLVLLPNDEEETFSLAIKAIDIGVSQYAIENIGMKRLNTDLLFNILRKTIYSDYFVEKYVKKLENI